MTWSSNNPDPQRSDLLTDELTEAESWAWVELEAPPLGPEGEAAQRVAEEESHRAAIEAAYQRGILDGQDAGAAIARDELHKAMAATLETLEEVRAQRVSWADRLREDLVILAAAMADRIVDGAVERDPEIFERLAAKAISSFRVDEPIRIRLHPADLERLHESGTVDDTDTQRNVRWMPDEEVVRGGCIVEGPDKIVDGRVDEALRRLIRELTSA